MCSNIDQDNLFQNTTLGNIEVFEKNTKVHVVDGTSNSTTDEPVNIVPDSTSDDLPISLPTCKSSDTECKPDVDTDLETNKGD